MKKFPERRKKPRGSGPWKNNKFKMENLWKTSWSKKFSDWIKLGPAIRWSFVKGFLVIVKGLRLVKIKQ
jgi:hypothetical protein